MRVGDRKKEEMLHAGNSMAGAAEDSVDGNVMLHSGDDSGSMEDDSSDSDSSDQDEGKSQAHIPLGERTRARPHKQGTARRQLLKTASAHESLQNKRLNKHAPVEERISRRPVSTLRDSVQRKKHKPKDPRFLPHMRTDDPKEQDFANRRYNFLYEDAIPSEVKELKASMKKAKTAHEKLRAQTRLSRLQETLRRHTDRKLEQEVETEWKQQERAKMEAGKNPFYLKESEKKKRVLEKKFAQLEETGQLEKYMSKKRKRQASKMRKQLPGRRQYME